MQISLALLINQPSPIGQSPPAVSRWNHGTRRAAAGGPRCGMASPLLLSLVQWSYAKYDMRRDFAGCIFHLLVP